MLVDSSVWIPFLRGDSTPEVEWLSSALDDASPVWLAPTILQEVLQGANNLARFKKWNRILGELPMLELADQRSTAREAAYLYARCRWEGVTPRSSNDCLIAMHAISHSMSLLHNDRDFVRIAEVDSRLKLVLTRSSMH